MMKFQRLASLSTDIKVVLAALKQGGSGLMDEDKQKIRRCPTVPLPEWNDARREELMNNTVYVKGFEKTQTTLDDLLAFFGNCPSVLNVTKRLYEDRKDPERKKHFKGSVFVVFKDRESAQNFMDLKELKSPDGKEELVRKWQKDYNEEKDSEFHSKRKQRNVEKQSQKNAREFSKSGDLDNKTNPTKEMADLPRGALLKLDGFAEDGDTSRENIRDKLVEDFGMEETSLGFSYYSKGQTSAILRFNKENYAKQLAETMSIKLSNQPIHLKCNQNTIKEEEGKQENISMECDQEISFKVLEGEEETHYLEQCKNAMLEKKQVRNHHKRRGGWSQGPGAKRNRKIDSLDQIG